MFFIWSKLIDIKIFKTWCVFYTENTSQFGTVNNYSALSSVLWQVVTMSDVRTIQREVFYKFPKLNSVLKLPRGFIYLSLLNLIPSVFLRVSYPCVCVFLTLRACHDTCVTEVRGKVEIAGYSLILYESQGLNIG